MTYFSTKKCLICKGGAKNDCLTWHESSDGGLPWVWCVGKCSRAYSMYEYTALAGISLGDFLKNRFEVREAPPNEVQKMEWPRFFVPLFDQRSEPALMYLKSRRIDPADGMYYDTQREGIVFPYYFEHAFVGAQIRFMKPFEDYDGKVRKIDTLPGTRTSYLVYGWNQLPLLPHIKGVIVTEGAFDSIVIGQALDHVYGGILKNPWKCIATSGSGTSKHKLELIRSLKESGIKTVIASDSDSAGQQMMEKFLKAEAVTHYAFTEDSEKDWNAFRLNMSKEEFARWFLGKVKHV